ncbi:Tol-Pal system beta propeller repeat protein TolB [Limobrevibacterium gyesilva]|uniref:Tol-Pal system protein TolB n=2 Tax=Limobrevibacterium gyesilva TaxID=2991712 RepID=A0AA41YNZ9_9PROT|nr:Tol-Pal system beta propeller repeat protein TolB [Limobrevibacterium gyesilva]MCW3477411.1 Tol-Pal system beta propeller repeat protein TolB [Limobrevibacterium gyesilva]
MTNEAGETMSNFIKPPSTQRLIGRRGLVAGTAGILAAPAIIPGAAHAQAPAAPNSAVIDVNRARTDPIPVAIPNLVGSGGDADRLGRDISGVITNNLVRSGLFRPIDPAAFIGGAANAGDVPNFQNWKAIGAQALVTGKVESQGGDKVRVEFRLWDVLPQQQIQGTAYTTTQSNWRRIAHIISDVIYERLLGEKGYFDTRVVYIAGSGPRDRRVKRLAIMDQDGENNRFLTDGGFLALTPRFHPTRDQIAFMSYVNDKPRVYLFDLGTGRQQMLGNFPGMTLSPRFSPDGNSVIMAQTNSGGSDIMLVGLNGGGARRLTDSGAIDVSPCFSPDGTQIAFNSDRGGDQQLYVMNADGSGVKRISYGRGRYATPVWSPRGDLIAFTRIGETFAIGVMRPDGSGERILSESFYCEGPTFAPNGRVIMFWRETPARDNRGNGFSARLVSIDITGFNERAVSTPTDASDPAWSPLLQ